MVLLMVHFIAQLVEDWTPKSQSCLPVVAAQVRDSVALDIYKTPGGDGLHLVAVVTASITHG